MPRRRTFGLVPTRWTTPTLGRSTLGKPIRKPAIVPSGVTAAHDVLPKWRNQARPVACRTARSSHHSRASAAIGRWSSSVRWRKWRSGSVPSDISTSPRRCRDRGNDRHRDGKQEAVAVVEVRERIEDTPLGPRPDPDEPEADDDRGGAEHSGDRTPPVLSEVDRRVPARTRAGSQRSGGPAEPDGDADRPADRQADSDESGRYVDETECEDDQRADGSDDQRGGASGDSGASIGVWRGRGCRCVAVGRGPSERRLARRTIPTDRSTIRADSGRVAADRRAWRRPGGVVAHSADRSAVGTAPRTGPR